jgi:hypothetical protein
MLEEWVIVLSHGDSFPKRSHIFFQSKVIHPIFLKSIMKGGVPNFELGFTFGKWLLQGTNQILFQN